MRAQLYVALDVGYLDRASFDELFDLTDKCSRQLSRFISYLRSRPTERSMREECAEYE